MDKGCLTDYLRARKGSLSQDTMLMMCLDVSEGMNYLESSNFLHRDLVKNRWPNKSRRPSEESVKCNWTKFSFPELNHWIHSVIHYEVGNIALLPLPTERWQLKIYKSLVSLSCFLKTETQTNRKGVTLNSDKIWISATFSRPLVVEKHSVTSCFCLVKLTKFPPLPIALECWEDWRICQNVGICSLATQIDKFGLAFTF